jgi:hypothetical protein
MIRWLEDNPLGIALASVCGGLLVISLLLAVIWALPASSSSAGPEEESNVPGLDVPELAGSESIEKYAVITEHPVFNNTRLPEIDLDTEELEEIPPEAVEAPEIELAGVIITPSIKMATLRQTGEKGAESLVAFEGMPLEGNFGSWLVSRIEAREITLSSDSGEEMQLRLEVHNVAIAAPPKPKPVAEEKKPEKETQARQGGDQPLSRAEEIRQRIAERREELRNAAEAEEEDEQQTYSQAIQSMMGQKRQGKEENESDK